MAFIFWNAKVGSRLATRGVAGVALVVLAAAFPPSLLAASAPSSALQDPDLAAAQQAVNAARVALRLGTWNTYAAAALRIQDARHRTVADDINEWVMDDEAARSLQQQTNAAHVADQRGDRVALRTALAAEQAVLDEQLRRLTVVSLYWLMRFVSVERQRQLWQAVLDQMSSGDASDSKARIDPLESKLVQELSPSMALDTLANDIRALASSYNQERIRLVRLLEAQRAAHGPLAIAPPARVRSLPCPNGDAPVRWAPVPGLDSSRGTPARELSIPDVANFYPIDARRDGISGRVVVKVDIAANGCVEQTTVVHSSGAPELDDAAVDFAQYMTFDPAQIDGRPVSSSPTLPIVFALSAGGD
jgi:TonB family protein